MLHSYYTVHPCSYHKILPIQAASDQWELLNEAIYALALILQVALKPPCSLLSLPPSFDMEVEHSQLKQESLLQHGKAGLGDLIRGTA